ncbi:MAG: flavodoxin family protein, partial [Methanomassiliicoccales archaeon]
MKVIAFNGSPRKNGNTFQALQIVLEELKNEGIETELVQIGSERIEGCTACMACAKNKNEKCIIETDNINKYIEMIKQADGIILGSPVYFGSVTSQ